MTGASPSDEEVRAATSRLEFVGRDEPIPGEMAEGASLSEDVRTLLAALSTPPADDVREALCWETVNLLGDTRRCRNRARAGMATCAVHASSEEALAWRIEEAEGERHAGYLQLHELVKDAPDGVRRAVGNDQQRVLANGSFSLQPSMLRHLLVRAYEQGLAYSARSVAPATDVRPRGPISDHQVLAALNATVKPESAAPDLSYWGDTHTAVMRAALESAEEVRS